MNFITVIFLILFAPSAYAENYAIIMGGAAHFNGNEFLPDMSDTANEFHSHHWQTTVLLDAGHDPKDWSKFSPSLRPKSLSDPNARFSLENFNQAVDRILERSPKPNDQVEISLFAHGGNIFGKHRIDWHDYRGQTKLSGSNSPLLF